LNLPALKCSLPILFNAMADAMSSLDGWHAEAEERESLRDNFKVDEEEPIEPCGADEGRAVSVS
jgi:hypothetical protein